MSVAIRQEYQDEAARAVHTPTNNNESTGYPVGVRATPTRSTASRACREYTAPAFSGYPLLRALAALRKVQQLAVGHGEHGKIR